MSKPSFKSKSGYLFFTLVGALAFNLSAWPGSQALGIQSSDHSSLSGCDLKRQLENPDVQEAACKINSGKTEGTIRVRQEERRVRDLSPNGDGNVKTVREWKIIYDLSAECSECGDGQRQTVSEVEYFNDVGNVDRIASEGFDKHSKRLTGEVTKAREDVRREEICLGRPGEDRPANEVVQCRIEKLNAMSGEKAAQYYQDHVENEVQALLESDRASDRQRGKTYLRQLGRSQNSFIRENTMDLAMYADYREQVNMISSQLEAYRSQPQDPRARLLAQQLTALKTQWSGYFTNRFGRESMMYDSTLGDFAAASALTTDLTDYDRGFKTSVDQVFASVPALHQQYLNSTGMGGVNNAQGGYNNMNTMPGGTGRNALGYESGRYQGAPGMPNNNMNNNMNNYGGMPQQQPGYGQMPMNGSGGGYMPQNSRMPMPGTSVFNSGVRR